jgi:protocatechuate 3,4-dioxygenase beta subunit
VLVEYIGAPTISGLPKTVTDDEGRYQLTGIPEGRFVVKAIAPSFVMAEGAKANQIGSRIISDNGFVGYILSIAKGDVIEGINFELKRGGVITGRVTDAEGNPIVEAQVSCSQSAQGGSGQAGAWTKTDDRGIYRIYGLPPGNYLVSVSGVSRGRRLYHQTFYPDVIASARATLVEVVAGNEARDIDIHLDQPDKSYNIRGQVIDDASGRPIPEISLSFRALDGSAVGNEGLLISDREGKFEIRNYPPGHYQIQVAFTGSPNQGYYSDPMAFEVMDADVTELKLKASRGATITGTVVIEGNTDPTLFSRLYPLLAEHVHPEGEAGMSGRPIFVSTIISPGGTFEFSGVRPGQTKIDVGSLPEGLNLVRIERAGVPVTAGINVLPGEHINGVRIVIAYGTGSIRGQVKVVGDNLPPRFGWLLEIRRTSGEQAHTEVLDSSGLFWVKGLVPGIYEVTATLDYAEIPGLTIPTAPVKQIVTVGNGKESLVSLELNLTRTNKN